MNEPKSYASLSSGLLARKGGAKPAMRPQSFTNFSSNIEDLGWNDMGGQQAEPFDHVPSSISALTPAPSGRSHILPSEAPADLDPIPESAPEPVVVEQQRSLEETFQPAEPEPEEIPETAEIPEIAENPEIAEIPASEEPPHEAELPEVASHPEPVAQAQAPRGDVVRLPKRQAVPAPVVARTKAAFTLRL
ncbi:MAG: hypothetical protein JWP15_3489, partial [Alphaproteobacteria bacterium]|nr:hypothetical protein [Alphaproteobacteria bacterium]